MEWFVLGLVISVLLWFFRPDWLRQLFRLDTKPPHYVAGTDYAVLVEDKVIGPTLPPPGAIGFFLEHQVLAQVQKGYELVLTPDGRRCIYKRGSETLVLLQRPD